jgi:hypothetical protein
MQGFWPGQGGGVENVEEHAGNFFSEAVHVVERFTMVDANTIHDEARIDDPTVDTKP